MTNSEMDHAYIAKIKDFRGVEITASGRKGRRSQVPLPLPQQSG